MSQKREPEESDDKCSNTIAFIASMVINHPDLFITHLYCISVHRNSPVP